MSSAIVHLVFSCDGGIVVVVVVVVGPVRAGYPYRRGLLGRVAAKCARRQEDAPVTARTARAPKSSGRPKQKMSGVPHDDSHTPTTATLRWISKFALPRVCASKIKTMQCDICLCVASAVANPVIKTNSVNAKTYNEQTHVEHNTHKPASSHRGMATSAPLGTQTQTPWHTSHTNQHIMAIPFKARNTMPTTEPCPDGLLHKSGQPLECVCGPFLPGPGPGRPHGWPAQMHCPPPPPTGWSTTAHRPPTTGPHTSNFVVRLKLQAGAR